MNKMRPNKQLLLTLMACCNYLISIAQTNSSAQKIRLNQVGFYPDAEKKAIVTSADTGKFYLQTSLGQSVFTGRLVLDTQPAFSGKQMAVANFTKFVTPGTYRIFIPLMGYSYPFNIKPSIHKSVADATIKAFYYQRASLPLAEKYAGKWHRAAGHPDNKVLIHASAANNKRPEGTIISSRRGWYDAGDYNKYIVNSGISTATLLSLYEDFPGYMNTVKLNIPESNNQLPDILDEVIWNLRWMLTMQDPNDGGVYHKLTNTKFDAMIMPDKAVKPRYVVQKGTAATLDFAAVTAQAARILKKFHHQLPGLADSCLKASLQAYSWALKNPNVIYDQDLMNKKFKPEITTGAYGDKYFADELIWAASELYVTTGKEEYLKTVIAGDDPKMLLPAWGNVKLLGYYSLIKKQPHTHPLLEIEARVLNFARDLSFNADKNAYQTVMGKSANNFNWGSNSNAANQGILLIKAYQLTHDKRYLNCALANLDYLLGRNGSGYSYITGYGSKSTMNPHHRPSTADGIVEPIPGLMAGGPNPGMQDGVKVPSIAPDEAYVDDDRAYAVNEVAINWNAPVAYLANAIEALQKDFGRR
ncbi:glycoside hydrolase family 9 protein [Mucilaginibacter sp. 10B2]|uniref:glycoside hydrolase family 9 protein n=2 Tax=unclassified Mucilaginibacter TaxID=2617802 RepID=UPI002B22B6C2|nr:glycoside hydrolase family 9 protein [Mucilaginibacter sp. 10B2]